MQFKNNFSDAHLIYGEPIQFSIIDEQTKLSLYTFEMGLPTYRLVKFDEDFKIFLGFISADIEKLAEQFKIFSTAITSHESLFGVLALFSETQEICKTYLNFVINGFKKLGVDFEVKKGVFWINNTCVAPKGLIDFMIRPILIASSIKKPEDFDQDPRMKALQEKINRIKAQNRKNTNPNNTETLASLVKTYMILTYEFGYTKEQVLDMTPFLMNRILEHTSGSINYKISLIAAGNGLSKKVHFITDKGGK